jgi:hypothetical protein
MEQLGQAPTSTFASVLGPVENILSSIGLHTPLKRLLFTTLTGTAAEFALKPSYAFNSDGSARSPIYLTRRQGDTYLPAGLLPGIAGLVFFLFI